MLKAFVEVIMPTLGTLAGSGLLAVLGYLVTWLRSRAQASKAAHVELVFAELAQSIVADLERGMKASLASYLLDGKITPEEGAMLKAEAMRRLKECAPPALKHAAEELFGDLATTWLSGLVERANAAQRPQVAVLPPMPR